jgi:DNA-directed RNA polymerase
LKQKRRKMTLTLPTILPLGIKERAWKPPYLISANWIHQKDAEIACNVVMRCVLNQIPIYTVHDHFITNTINAKSLFIYR